jgi:SAM-dependent methyltransferase
MVDRCYDQKDLVALYDLINSDGPDWNYYLVLAAGIVGAEIAPARVLAAGCDTGALAVEMARLGAGVTGLDPAEAMLAVARARAGAALVQWQHGTLQSFHSDQRYDLIYMTGHAFQCLLADDDILQAFLAVAAVLAPGRQFVFETRNPACAPWQNWVPTRSEIALFTADDVAARLWHQQVEITGDYVTFDQYHAFADPTALVISRSCLRFCTLAQIEAFATAAGLRVVRVVGDWKGAAFTCIEREIIVHLQRV